MQSDQIISLNKFITNANKFVKDLGVSQKPLFLTQNDNAVAVVQDIKHYNKLLDALYFLRLMVQGEKDIHNENYFDQSEVFKDIDKILDSKVEGIE